MSRTRDHFEDLRDGQEKIEDLRNEEEKHSLGEMAENGDDGEGHSGEIAKRVTDEHTRGIPVESEKR